MVNTVFRVLDRAIEWLIIGIFIALVLTGGMQVFNRFVLNNSLSWSEEFQRYAHIWMVYLAIPVAYRRGMHIGMDVLKEKMSPMMQKILCYFVHGMWIALSVTIMLFTLKIMKVAARQTSSGLGISMDYAYLGLFIGSLYLLVVALRKLGAEFLYGRNR